MSPGVIFDGDFDAGIQRLTAGGLANFDRVRHARLDAARRLAVSSHAENAAERGRLQRLRDADAQGEMLLGGAPFLVEVFRGRTNAPRTRIKDDVVVIGLLFEVFQIRFVETFVNIQVRQE